MLRIRKLRKEKGYTMKQLGEAIGVAESTVSLYENGKREPDNETLKKLADIFNVSVDYLVERSNFRNALDEQLSNEPFALYGEVHDLSDEEKEAVLNFIKFTKAQREQRGK